MTTEHSGTGSQQSTTGDAVDSEMGPPEAISASYGGGLGSSGTASSGSSYGSTTEGISSMGSGNSPTGSSDMGAGSGDKLKDTAGRVANRVSDTIGEEVDSRAGAGFDRAGTVLEHVADAVERAGDELRPEEAPVADVARAAAGQLRSAAGYIRSADMGTIVGNAEEFARRQPAIFLGGALAIGLMASRFLKASPTQSSGYRYTSETPGRFSAGMSSGYRAYGGYRSPTGAGTTRASTVAGMSSGTGLGTTARPSTGLGSSTTPGAGMDSSTSSGGGAAMGSSSTSSSLSGPTGTEGLDDRV